MRMTAIVDVVILLGGSVRVAMLELFGNIQRKFRPLLIAFSIGVGVHLPIRFKTDRVPW